jgi:hypothetical protein
LSHYGHQSIDNNNLIYWKETKTFANGCGSHLKNGFYKKGNMLLPDQATFIIDNVVIGDDTMMEANHHCNVGTTGVLCMPTYILHKVKWENSYSKGNRGNRPWMSFQKKSFQPHNSDQNHVSTVSHLFLRFTFSSCVLCRVCIFSRLVFLFLGWYLHIIT